MDIESYAISDKGLVRSSNEDVFALMKDEGIFILADGLGGHNAGEIAASSAVEYMMQEMQSIAALQRQDIILSEQSIMDFLEKSMQNANLWVHGLSLSNPHLHGMGTTLSMIFLQKEVLYLSHVGDSRIYYLHEEDLQLLTHDHIHDLFDERGMQTKKILSQAIGTSLKVCPDIQKISYHTKDLFLICSDGLSDLLPENDIKTLLSKKISLEEIGRDLILAAKKSGGYDNITLMLIRIP